MSLGSEPWVEWFCRSHPCYVEVDEDYIRDDFNLTGLAALVPNYGQALDVILDSDYEDSVSDGSISDHSSSSLNRSANLLYGLIHARGLNAMWEKFLDQVYGVCPRDCTAGSQPVGTLPFGMSNMPGQSCTAVYCGVCKEVYRPANGALASIDGSHFGSTFCHLFFIEFAEKLKNRKLRDPTRPLPPPEAMEEEDNAPPYYVPKVFGYKVSPLVRDRKIKESPLMNVYDS